MRQPRGSVSPELAEPTQLPAPYVGPTLRQIVDQAFVEEGLEEAIRSELAARLEAAAAYGEAWARARRDSLARAGAKPQRAASRAQHERWPAQAGLLVKLIRSFIAEGGGQ